MDLNKVIKLQDNPDPAQVRDQLQQHDNGLEQRGREQESQPPALKKYLLLTLSLMEVYAVNPEECELDSKLCFIRDSVCTDSDLMTSCSKPVSPQEGSVSSSHLSLQEFHNPPTALRSLQDFTVILLWDAAGPSLTSQHSDTALLPTSWGGLGSRMLSWVAKVVPHLPEPPPKNVEEQKLGKPVATPPAEKKVTFLDESKKQAPKDGKPKQEVQAAESGPEPVAQSGVFTWFNATLPKPALPTNLSRANSIAQVENTTTRKGMMTRISEGLEKVVPQPDLKKETPAEPEQHIEVSVAAPEKPAEPQINVEEREEHTDNRLLPPRMLDWIKQGLEKVVPQPKTEIMERTEAPAVSKAPEPAPETKAAPETEKSSKEGEMQANIMGWVGRMLPQPALRLDAGCHKVQNRG
ncbi:hypothetical protein NQZ68_038462 [Dissostichus eleginoides]|nr:hypothetical protein NQZ68_038462 [Dissostichus eleginoides]